MKPRVFIDTDVLLDLLAARQPFAMDAQLLFSVVDARDVEGLVSALSFPNIYYILRKELGHSRCVRALEKLKSLVTVVSLDDKAVSASLASGFKDFEDATQYYSALQARATHLVTRNVRDFKSADLPVLTPRDFISAVLKI